MAEVYRTDKDDDGLLVLDETAKRDFLSQLIKHVQRCGLRKDVRGGDGGVCGHEARTGVERREGGRVRAGEQNANREWRVT